MPVLMRDGVAVAPLEIADRPLRRLRGLLGRDRVVGALLLTPARSVHTIGMRFPIDVVHLDEAMVVLAVRAMPPNRLGRRVRGTRHVVEAPLGSCAGWGITVGSILGWALDGRAQAAA